MSNGDYGYFSKGDTGYAQYMTAFNRARPAAVVVTETTTTMAVAAGTAAGAAA